MSPWAISPGIVCTFCVKFSSLAICNSDVQPTKYMYESTVTTTLLIASDIAHEVVILATELYFERPHLMKFHPLLLLLKLAMLHEYVPIVFVHVVVYDETPF